MAEEIKTPNIANDPIDESKILKGFESDLKEAEKTRIEEEAARRAQIKPEEKKQEELTPEERKRASFFEEDDTRTPEEIAAAEEAKKVEDAKKLEEAKKEMPTSAKNWATLKENHQAELDTRDTEIEKLKSEAETSSANSPQYKALVDENKAMRDQLSQIDLANSPDFHKKYTAPGQALHKDMASILTANNIEMTVDKLMAMPEKEMRSSASEIIEQLDALDSGIFKDTFIKYLALDVAATNALADSEKTKQSMSSEHNYNVETAHKEAWERVTANGSKFFKEVEADDPNDTEDVETAREYNDQLNSIVERVKQRAQSPRSLAQLAEMEIIVEAYKLVTGPGMKRIKMEWGRQNTEIRSLRSKIAARDKHNPQIRGNIDEASIKKGEERPAPKTEKDVLKNFEADIREAGIRK